MGVNLQDILSLSTLEVAQHLIGWRLCRKFDDNRVIMDTVVETEAYLGKDDLASHARFGKTKRNIPMFGPAGIWYVYLCYGIHYMLNLTTEPIDYPGAVLIRSLQNTSGPGRLTKIFNITQRFNGLSCATSTQLWLLPPIYTYDIQVTPRIGIQYAGAFWAQQPFRFIGKLIK